MLHSAKIKIILVQDILKRAIVVNSVIVTSNTARWLFSPKVKGTRQLLVAAETIPRSYTRVDESNTIVVEGFIVKSV